MFQTLSSQLALLRLSVVIDFFRHRNSIEINFGNINLITHHFTWFHNLSAPATHNGSDNKKYCQPLPRPLSSPPDWEIRGSELPTRNIWHEPSHWEEVQKSPLLHSLAGWVEHWQYVAMWAWAWAWARLKVKVNFVKHAPSLLAWKLWSHILFRTVVL